MHPNAIREGDLVEVRINGAVFPAEVGTKSPKVAAISPQNPIVYQHRYCTYDRIVRVLQRAETPTGGSRAASMLAEFHDCFDYERTVEPRLRLTLHEEEHEELKEALVEGDREAIARELADVVYVAYGSAWSLDIDLDAALAEVHRANLSKLGDDGRPVYREDGKVLKGPNFKAPDMSKAVA